jgi:hypothetical protein
VLVVGVVFVVNNVTCVALFWRETLVGASFFFPSITLITTGRKALSYEWMM